MHPNDKALVRNAADPEQVKAAEHREKMGRDREMDDVRTVISTPHGKRFIARLLARCRVSQSIWHPSALIHHNAGAQDVGHFIMGELVQADQKLASEMVLDAYRSELNPKGDS